MAIYEALISYRPEVLVNKHPFGVAVSTCEYRMDSCYILLLFVEHRQEYLEA